MKGLTRMFTRKNGFTLIELLVVISIIALLMSILMPSLAKVKEQARVAVCASRIHQTGLALGAYAVDNDGKYPEPVLVGFYPNNYGGHFDLSGRVPLPGLLNQRVEQTAHIALIMNNYLDPSFMFCPAAKSSRQLTYDAFLENQRAMGSAYPSTKNPSDCIFVQNYGWAFSYPYWVGYCGSKQRNLNPPSHYDFLVSNNTPYKINKLIKTIAENATSRSDTVAMSDLTCTGDESGSFDGDSSQPWASSFTDQIYANHLSGGGLLGGNTLYNDGSAEWEKLSSMQKETDNHRNGIDHYRNMRVNIYNGADNTYFWF